MGNAIQVDIGSQPTGPEAPAQTERPAHIPEKFWDAETKSVNTDALLASYTELEKKIGAPKPDQGAQPDAANTDADKAKEGEGDADKTAQAAVDAAGLNMEELQAEVDKDGKLSDASYEKLAKVGFDKATVDDFIEYRRSQADSYVKAVKSAAGAEGDFERMVDWAAKSYSKEQADAFNEAVNSGNRAKAEAAVKALKTDFVKANGSPAKLLKGGTGGAPAADRYESLQQMLADQAKPEYATDPAFRQRVIEKLKRSNI